MMEKKNNRDPIEELFRRKAEEYDISYREADWLKLEKRLDQQQQQRANRRKRWMIAAAVLLLFSLLSYAVYENYQDINNLSEKLSRTEIPEKEQTDDSSSIAKTKDTQQKTSEANRSEQPSDASGNRAPQSSTGRGSATAEKTGGSDPENSGQPSKFSIPYSSLDQLAVNQLAHAVPSLPGAQKIRRFPLAVSPSHLAADPKSLRTSSTGTAEPQLSSASQARAAIGIVAGPDLSTVGSLSDFYEPGYNLGILAEYRLAPDLTIRGGIIRSSVRYVADGREYHPPGGFWSYGTVPNKTTARCVILDIPISLKYRFWNFDRSRLYATAGLSSYIMLNEEYRFDYAESNGHLVQGWSGKTGSRHWFSNVSLSVGYAFDLNRKISLQIEPFLKLPVQGVGWGDVRLYSTGSMISFSYKLY